jgi:hypothetical protein
VVTDQATAATLALVLLVAGAARLVSGKMRPSVVAWFALSVPIPAVGLGLYAIEPGPLPQFAWLLWPILVLVAVGVPAFFKARSLQRVLPISKTATLDMFESPNRYFLASYACLAVGIDLYVCMFEPVFGVANLIAGGIWTAAWVPQRWRQMHFEVATTLGAPASLVYAYLIEPSNWRRYQADLEEVTVTPEGKLRVGSEVTVRRQYSFVNIPEGAVRVSLVTTSVVTAMVPDVSYTTRLVGRGDVGTTEVHPAGSGSTLTTRADGPVGLVDAILGLKFEIPRALTLRREWSLKNFARLNELLSAPVIPQ